MDYTDEEMIKMLTNECPNAFRQVVAYIIKKLSAQLYRFVIRHGGQEIYVNEILNYALHEAHLNVVKGRFRENTNVLGYVNRVAQNKFYTIIKGDNKLPLTNIDDMTDDLSDTSNEVNELEALEERIKDILEALEQLKPENKAFLLDAILSGMSREDLAKKYKLKNSQSARNKISKLIIKIRDLLSPLNNEDE